MTTEPKVCPLSFALTADALGASEETLLPKIEDLRHEISRRVKTKVVDYTRFSNHNHN